MVMNLNDYQRAALRTWPHRNKTDALVNSVLSLNEEAGEVAGLLKKYLYHGHDLNLDDLASELGDVLYYVAVVADTIEFGLDDVAIRNREKLQKRYPDGFDEERSRNRVDA
jgi:NTP pyrophosphatase (non-canonical NTP hydrolase)